jgi:hypothetical protein
MPFVILLSSLLVNLTSNFGIPVIVLLLYYIILYYILYYVYAYSRKYSRIAASRNFALGSCTLRPGMQQYGLILQRKHFCSKLYDMRRSFKVDFNFTLLFYFFTKRIYMSESSDSGVFQDIPPSRQHSFSILSCSDEISMQLVCL